MILKKSLGQHFLKDERVCKRIVAALREHPFTQLLEVGPGGGALTRFLLDLPGVDFRAVELDREKVDHLVQSFPQIRDDLIHGSFLEIDKPFPGKFTVVGNFPYNISSQILFRVIEWKDSVECMVGMFQKEMAQRVASREGSKAYGVTSVLAQAFFTVEYLFEVPESAFYPPPKVRSAVIRLLPRREPLAMRSEKDLFRLVKAAFNQRRKTLRNAVKDLFDLNVLQEEQFGRRAEQLSVSEFAALTFRMR